MWRKIAKQDFSFGNLDKFCSNPEKSNWISPTVAVLKIFSDVIHILV